MTRFRRFIALFAVLALIASPARALSRDALRALAAASGVTLPESPFLEAPSLSAPYAAGTLDPALVEAALARMNFLRALAGLPPAAEDARLTALSQHGAALMAARRAVTHAPERPADMDDAFFALAAEAAVGCNLASFNWFSPALAADCMDWFARDDTPANLGELAHRRWLLSPDMAFTGFGLALDEEGRSYAALYVTDASAAADYDFILWPAEGAFPAALMRAETPWSVSPNPALCDLSLGEPRVLLEELTSGARWAFDPALDDGARDGAYCLVDMSRRGGSPALIFRPDLMDEPALQDGYEQNQLWRVTLSGLAAPDGSPLEPAVYLVEMASLTPLDPASVELSERALRLGVGESVEIAATVYPRWADDLSYTLSVSDEAVAAVEGSRLTGVGAGVCVLRAETVNGRFDEIEVTVVQLSESEDDSDGVLGSVR